MAPSPQLLLRSVALPLALVAVTSYQLRDSLNEFADYFLAAKLADQASFLTLLFASLFGVLALALALLVEDDDDLMNKKKKKTDESSVVEPGSRFLFATPTLTRPKLKYPFQALKEAKTDKERMLAMYPMLRDEMIAHMKENNEMNDEALAWCTEMMDYNVPGGKLNRGTTVLAVLRTLKQHTKTDDDGTAELTELEIAQAAVCGWSLEFLQAFFLVADDVMDDSKTRREQPCWYRVPKVGLIAINDSFLLESYVLRLLKNHFLLGTTNDNDGNNEQRYAALLDLMMDVIQKTEFGQLLDLTSQTANAKMDLSRFTLERYKLIVKYKTAFYSFYLPTAMGMILSGMTNPQAYAIAQDICCQMGEYFQIQDDYLDCFGDPAVIGKIGTDIQENKCSWLVVQALQRLTDKNSRQYKTLEQNYGQWNDGKVSKIKALYKDLDLPKVFTEYEEASYLSIQKQVEQVADMVPKDVFDVLLQKIYKRSK